MPLTCEALREVAKKKKKKRVMEEKMGRDDKKIIKQEFKEPLSGNLLFPEDNRKENEIPHRVRNEGKIKT